MAIRNYSDLSSILKKIANRFLANQILCKLLHYNNTDPLSQPDIIDTKKLLGDEIRFKPKIDSSETTKSKIAMVFPSATRMEENHEITKLPLQIYVYTPLEEWVIKGDDLRVFLIMSEIEKTLDGKEVGGVGKLNSHGFDLVLTTDLMCGYRMDFSIDILI